MCSFFHDNHNKYDAAGVVPDIDQDLDIVSLSKAMIQKCPSRCILPIFMRIFTKCQEIAKTDSLFDLLEIMQSMMQ